MPEIDYGDDAVTPKVGVFSMPTPEINEDRARGYMAEHRQRGADAEKQFESIMQRRQAAIEEAREKMEASIATMRERQNGGGLGGINLPLLAMAAGFLKPAPVGQVSNFGQELGNALTGLGQTVRAQRMSDVELESGIAALQQKMAQLRDKGIDDEAGFAKAKALKEDAMVGDLEKVLIKSGAAGSKPALVKEYEEWIKDPSNAGKTYANFLEWKNQLGANKNDPASLRELKAANDARVAAGQPPMTLEEFTRAKAAAQAGGKETGKSTAEAAMALPNALATIDSMQGDIDKIMKHPGLPNATGFMSIIPNRPGSKATDAEELLTKLRGQAFLIQFDKLRGAGAITESEGKKATDALAALASRQSTEQLKKHLQELRDLLETGRSRLRQKAGQGADAGPASGTPDAPVVLKDPQQLASLKSGTVFIAPDGKPYVKE